MDDRDLYESYVEIEECARNMGITTQRVRELISRRALRSIDLGVVVLVQPAILSGAVR